MEGKAPLGFIEVEPLEGLKSLLGGVPIEGIIKVVVECQRARKKRRGVLKLRETLEHIIEKKFGFIFIVCATDKTAEEMLTLLNERIPNDKESELKIAKNEQNKITHLRIKKLIA